MLWRSLAVVMLLLQPDFGGDTHAAPPRGWERLHWRARHLMGS